MAELLIDGVSKRYGRDSWALRDLSLRLDGGVLGLVGPNGAGKTTLLRILATVLAPTMGVITWQGRDIARHPRELRHILGYLPQDFGVYPRLNARDFLLYVGELKGLQGPLLRRRVESVLEAVHLRAEANTRLRAFSGGMLRRVGIAQALLNEPRLLVLDEPTVGLDPAERVHLRRLLTTLGRERLVVLSTHIISDIEATASDLALLQKGRLTWSGTPEGLLADAEGQAWTLTMAASEAAAIKRIYPISAAAWQAGLAHLRLLSATQPHPLAIPVAPTLEDAYMLFVGAENAPAAAPASA